MAMILQRVEHLNTVAFGTFYYNRTLQNHLVNRSSP
ncbi:hypothetical protein ANCDUO_02627 [Ancylostoma duodenale]|uniref:Uncharacterized protein n=1 Tax=Ancylostoma duodenale TaxID=51022 RepID=A0A0C2DVY4_9BILA|nr:hypothetical protein ANCDUO_02627 [Ancylostoma duodenale]